MVVIIPCLFQSIGGSMACQVCKDAMNVALPEVGALSLPIDATMWGYRLDGCALCIAFGSIATVSGLLGLAAAGSQSNQMVAIPIGAPALHSNPPVALPLLAHRALLRIAWVHMDQYACIAFKFCGE